MLQYGKPGRGLLWVTCLESVSLTARLRSWGPSPVLNCLIELLDIYIEKKFKAQASNDMKSKRINNRYA
jgi:hypothetical protein